jgi:hypothetical protein
VTQSLLQPALEIAFTFGGAAILVVFAVALAVPHRQGTQPASRGHREQEGESEEVRPDGFIDTFAGQIEEAGGGLPWIVRIALVGVIVWWFLYLVIYWTPK